MTSKLIEVIEVSFIVPLELFWEVEVNLERNDCYQLCSQIIYIDLYGDRVYFSRVGVILAMCLEVSKDGIGDFRRIVTKIENF